MPTNMGPPQEPRASSSSSSNSNKRKQPDEDELLLEDQGLRKAPIENEYEDLDEDDDLEDNEDETTSIRTRAVYEAILKVQEPSTISQYDDIKITPFNLEEELEDGEFDQTGNFVFRRGSPTDDDNNDKWAESIDWEAVERRERETKERRQQESKQDRDKMDAEEESKSFAKDRLSCYKQLLRVMRPDETVQKTIRRLGNEVPKRRPVNNKSKARLAGQQADSVDDQRKIAEARKKLDIMIELAHHLLEDGDTDIYQKTYESLEEAIN